MSYDVITAPSRDAPCRESIEGARRESRVRCQQRCQEPADESVLRQRSAGSRSMRTVTTATASQRASRPTRPRRPTAAARGAASGRACAPCWPAACRMCCHAALCARPPELFLRSRVKAGLPYYVRCKESRLCPCKCAGRHDRRLRKRVVCQDMYERRACRWRACEKAGDVRAGQGQVA